MSSSSRMDVRMLGMSEIHDYLRVLVAADADSGVDGNPHSNANSASEPFDVAGAVERERLRWTTEIDTAGWRRAWGLFDGPVLVGQLHLVGGSMMSEMHRVGLGMGIVASRRRQGGGTALLQAAIAWSRAQSQIEWIDLGVFSDNPGARSLYEQHGFGVVGSTPDRYRVDGVVLGETAMCLNVAQS